MDITTSMLLSIIIILWIIWHEIRHHSETKLRLRVSQQDKKNNTNYVTSSKSVIPQFLRGKIPLVICRKCGREEFEKTVEEINYTCPGCGNKARPS